MSSKKTLNIKSTGSVIFLIILFIVAQQYGNELKAPLK